MPSPRAVLRDIADLGLDPMIAYSRISTDGRVRNRRRPEPEVIVLTIPGPTEHQKKDVAIVEDGKIIVDVKVDDDTASIAVPADEEITVIASSKKIRAKKAEKTV